MTYLPISENYLYAHTVVIIIDCGVTTLTYRQVFVCTRFKRSENRVFLQACLCITITRAHIAQYWEITIIIRRKLYIILVPELMKIWNALVPNQRCRCIDYVWCNCSGRNKKTVATVNSIKTVLFRFKQNHNVVWILNVINFLFPVIICVSIYISGIR